MECPNCGAHIGRFELDQNCRECGVNLFYCQQEKLLAEDAKKCELEFASFRVLVEKLKTAFIKGALPIARIVLCVASVGAVMLPFASLKLVLPMIEKSMLFSGYGLISAFTSGAPNVLMNFSELSPARDVVIKSALLALSIALVLLTSGVILLTELLSFTNIKKSARAMEVLSVIGIAFSACASVLSFIVASCRCSYIEASAGVGGFVCAAVFAALFIDNYLIIKKGIAPVYNELDLLRIDMRKKVKSGEVNIDDLPLPVFETEEEREVRLAAEAELAKKGVADVE